MGREFTWFLNTMAGLGFSIVSSETHFKEELCFFLDGLVCKYRVSISRPALPQICVLAWLKGSHTHKLPSGLYTTAPGDQRGTSLAAFVRASSGLGHSSEL